MGSFQGFSQRRGDTEVGQYRQKRFLKFCKLTRFAHPAGKLRLSISATLQGCLKNRQNHGQQNHFLAREARCRADLVAAVYDCRGLPVQTTAEEDLSAPRLSMTADHQE